MIPTSWKKCLLMLLCAVLLAWVVWQAEEAGNHLQFLTLAPAPEIEVSQEEGEEPVKPNAWLTKWQEDVSSLAEEWKGILSAWTMDGVIETASFSTTDGGSASGRLALFGLNGQQLHPLYLLSGRLMYPEELKNGDRVCLLDEQLALALFRISEPIDMKVLIGAEEYRVIGIVRHTRRVGDRYSYGAYIPLFSMVDQETQLDVIQVEAEPIAGTGASAAFTASMSAWQQNGTLIDLGKEGMGAWLWVRVLLTLMGLSMMLWFVGILNRQVSLSHRTWKERLKREYAARLFPWAFGRIALFAIGYGLCAGLFALLMTFILQPVYIFPEWVPAVLVEPSDIADAFWKVWGSAATLVELRSPELNRLRFLTLLADGFSAVMGVLFFQARSRMRTPDETVASALPALQRQGCAVSLLRSRRPMPLEDLGYARLPSAGEDNGKRGIAFPLLRIVNVRRVLEALPPSHLDGSFVLDVTDAQIAANNVRLLITCTGGKTTLTEAHRDWDMHCPVETLTRLIYGTDSLDRFLETQGGIELHMRSPAMDGLFAHHLTPAGDEVILDESDLRPV